VVERLDQLAGHELRHVVDRREEDVVVDLARLELRDRLLHVVEGLVLDLNVEFLTEVVQDLLPHVLLPVVDHQGPGLRLEVRVDRRVVVVGLERDRVVEGAEAGDLILGARIRRPVPIAATGGEDRGRRRQGHAGGQ
jgi:hypothetical protein